jgi:low affinity Fe/Cu permease
MKEIKVWKAAMDTTPEEISNLSRKIDDIIRDRAREKSEELNENRVTPKEIAANLLARNAARPVQVGRHDRCSPCIEGDMMPTSKKPTPKKPKSMLAKVHDRVFNGLGQELREEVSYAMGSFRVEVVKLLDDARKERREDISELRKLVIGVIVSMAILLGGVVLQNQISSAARSNENNRNLDAIKDLGVKLDLHIGGVDLPPGLPYRAQTKLGPK